MLERYDDFEAQCLQMAPVNLMHYRGMRKKRVETAEGMPCLCKLLMLHQKEGNPCLKFCSYQEFSLSVILSGSLLTIWGE